MSRPHFSKSPQLALTLVAAFWAGVLWGAPSLARVPLGFEPSVRGSEFFAHAKGLSVMLSSTGASIGTSRMRLVGASGSAPAQPEELLPGYTNYLLDSDPRKWRAHVPNYRRVRYRNVYRGIDVVYYGNPGDLEFDFVVAPGADPRQIRLSVSDPHLRIRLPRAYQKDRAVEARAVRRGSSITFVLAAYDRTETLVIDPVLSFATVFGGGGYDEGRAIAADSTGATYVVGNAGSGNFPVVNGKPGVGGSFLAKINPAGDALVFSTYLPFPVAGGPPGNVAIDSSGSAYFAGPVFTQPNVTGPPVLGPAPLGTCTGGQAMLYVAKLSSDGASLRYSGCMTGTTFQGPNVIAFDGSGNAYVSGWTLSADFPLVNPLPYTPPTNPGPPRAFVFKLGPAGALLYSTFFGRSGEIITALAADLAGNIYLAGQTTSQDFPLKNALQTERRGSNPSFVAKIKADGSDLVYSTYFGGSNIDSVSAIATDSVGNTYIAGSTTSSDFPTTANALQTTSNGVFAYKSTDGAANWSRSDSGLPGSVNVLRIDPRNPSNLYVVSSNRVYKSSDNGGTWQPTSLAPVGSLWINPADSTLYAGTNNSGSNSKPSVLRSRDGGAHFTTVNPGLKGTVNQMVFDPQNPSVIYGRWGGGNTQDGVYKSIDGGDTWKATGISGAATGCCGLAIDPARPSTLYASTHQGGLMHSEDGGDTWISFGSQVNQILVDSTSTLYSVSGSTIYVLPLGGATVVKVAPGSIMTLAIDPTNSSTWYAIIYGPSGPGNSIYKSTDGGDNWQRVGNGLPSSPGAAPLGLAIDPSAPGTVYLGTFGQPDGFLSKLNPDGSSLLYSTYLGGSGNDSATAIAADAAGNIWVAGTTDSPDFPMQAPFRTPSVGLDGFVAQFDPTNALLWSSPLGGGTPRSIALGSAGELYVTGVVSSPTFPTPKSIQPFMSSNFFWTSDRGTAWTPSPLPISPQAPPVPPFSTPIVVADPKTPARVYALSDRLYVSNDRGQNWTPRGSPANPGPLLFPPPFGGAPLLVLDPLTPATMYAAANCTFANNGPPTCGVSKSTDAGSSWTFNPITISGPGPQPVFVNGLAIDPKTPSRLYAASSTAGIFKSTDGGATWTGIFPLTSAATVAVDPQNPTVVYASFGSNTGSIFRSPDAGSTWATITNGLPTGWFANVLVTDRSVPGRVYALGSFSSTGLYRTENGGSNWIKIGSGLPDGAIVALTIDPNTSSTVYAAPSGGGLYRSTDAGASFILMPGLRIPIVSAIAIDPTNSSQIYTGTQFNPADAFVMKIAQ